MYSEVDAPGLKIRRNKGGTKRLYWVARADIVTAGYQPETVRLFYNIDDPDQVPLIEASCRKLQAEMLAWTTGARSRGRKFDGTVTSLVRLYQVDEASPYRELKWNTCRTYDQVLKTIERAFGKRTLTTLKIGDFRRWYDEAKKPKSPGQPERIRKAHGIIAMFRRLFAYGTMAELPECRRLAGILEVARFKQPGRRRQKLEIEHVRAFIPKAIEAGRLSLAIGTAIQFETGMRQRDVIGEWEPIPEGAEPTGIVLRGRRWVRGLTWSDLGNDFVIHKETTKTGSIVSHDLKLCPLALEALNSVPLDRRIGPLIVDEEAGRHYAEHAYAREWRIVARTAGIPDSVWNMDARAGAITEAEDAGADLDEIRGSVGHTQASTTARYSRGAIGKSRKVAALRAAHRQRQNKS